MLHTDIQGDGPELVLLHGWGMHSGVWGEWLRQLQRCFRVTAVDLPGHGNSAYQRQQELRDWAAAVLDVAPKRAWWAGWSLGGLIALEAAGQEPGRFAGLLLLASTPRFVQGDDWAPAVPAEVLGQFAGQLEVDTARTLSRFLSLQVRGSEGASEALRQLRADLNSRPAADPTALGTGLRFLQGCDLRHILHQLHMPLLWVLGERDTLIPAQVADQFPDVASTVIPGAGHAPFLSHTLQCTASLQRLLSEAGGGRNAAS